MSATLHIHLNLPADLYERTQEAAVRSDQPIESVLVDSLSLLFGAPPLDWDHLAATLETLPDTQLWALVYRRIAWTASGRLRELAARGKREALTDEEQAELTRLIDDYDRMTLLRSQALVMLQQRGHDVQSQLQRGGEWHISHPPFVKGSLSGQGAAVHIAWRGKRLSWRWR